MATEEFPLLYFGVNESEHVHYYHAGCRFVYILVHVDGRVEHVNMGDDVANGEVRARINVDRGGGNTSHHMGLGTSAGNANGSSQRYIQGRLFGLRVDRRFLLVRRSSCSWVCNCSTSACMKRARKVERTVLDVCRFDFVDFDFVHEDALRERLNGHPDTENLLRFIKPDRRRNFVDYYEITGTQN